MESWGRTAWVGRAANVHAHAVEGVFSGWSLGLSGPISARLYDKTLEIEKSKREWIKELWRERGWNSEDRVWRLEFQLRRDVLDSLTTVQFATVLDKLPGIWTYCTNDWLRLCLPNPADSTRGRWPLHPLWAALQRIDWGAPSDPLSRQYRPERVPQAPWIFRQVMGLICSFVALRGIQDLGDGMERLRSSSSRTWSSGRIWSASPRVSSCTSRSRKVRKFNLAINVDEIPDEDRKRPRKLEEAAAEYRRLSRGG